MTNGFLTKAGYVIPITQTPGAYLVFSGELHSGDRPEFFVYPEGPVTGDDLRDAIQYAYDRGHATAARTRSYLVALRDPSVQYL